MALTQIKGTTFKSAKGRTAPRRLIMSLEGDERQGKTHFALTAPEPIAYLPLDAGGDDLIAKFQASGKELLVCDKFPVRVNPTDTPADVGKKMKPIWERFVAEYQAALAAARTVVVDTGSESYKLCKLKWFGKLLQIMPEDYAYPNTEFTDLIREAYNHSANVIWLHKRKDEWDKSKAEPGKKGGGKKTGERIRDGFSGMGYEVQIEATARKDAGLYIIDIKNCRQNAELDGTEMIIEDADQGFAQLAQLVYPDSDLSDWI